jgi:hypothetical protein
MTVMAMDKVRDFKRRADSVLEEVFRSLFEEIDTDKLRREVESLQARLPGFSPRHHARMLSRRTAIRCAAAGAVTGIPVFGALAIGTLGADLAYLVYQQFRMILGIATVYGHEPSSRERFNEALSCLAFSSGVGVGKQGLASMLGATVEGGALAERIGTRFLRDRFVRFVPFVGAISGGALNYAAVHAVSRSAIRYYESRIDPVVAEEIWAEGDREHA